MEHTEQVTQETDPLVLVFSRNAFYRGLYLLALATLGLCILVMGLLIGVIVYLKEHPTKPLFFATDTIGRFIPIIPVEQPNMSNDDVGTYAKEAVEAAFSYDYINFHAQLQNAQRYFTNYGWQNYMKALVASNNLPALSTRKYIVVAQVTNKPKLVTAGILSGAYAWKFDMPVLVNYWSPPYNDSSKLLNTLQVTVIVQRQPILQSYRGLGVVQVISNLVTSTQLQGISGAAPTG